MGQFAETHFAESGKMSLPCPFCRIFFRQSGHRNSAKWASKFGKVGKAVVYICKNRLFESENIMWGIPDVYTLALTVAKNQLPLRSLRDHRSRKVFAHVRPRLARWEHKRPQGAAGH